MTKDFLTRLAEEHYGTTALPVYGRLLKEWQMVRRGPLVAMWHCTAAMRQSFGADVLILGCTNNSLLAHLLGATPVNPLPPHYHCPCCHHFSFADSRYEDGEDLPKKPCPQCGGVLDADGHDLRSWALVGENAVAVQVRQEVFGQVCAWLTDYWMRRDCPPAAEDYSDEETVGLRITLPDGVQGVFEVRVMVPNEQLDPLPADVPPLNTAYRRLKGMGLRLASDAWTGAERDAVERGALAFEEVIAFREDVYDLLRRYTPPEFRRENGLPWAISEEIRKGKYAGQRMPKLIENLLRKRLRVPEYYIKAIRHIQYLPSKGDCAARMMGGGGTATA